ncbi:Uma2 family endonuclease [Kineosporia sp. J2-2]|uniref:Uma2 family endonuclease n=1 Tax=Kineosporia corallincola TaxID=2835133 RepID=A0ABS5TCY3_9ACTN|nr:Uma2 family endonuclease [Kineosporia corallincola]MBT0768942.1 Uma2 family endonuclease [Kineosporia corallincola]
MTWPYVVHAWEQLNVPEGWSVARMTREEIRIFPVAGVLHDQICSEVSRRFAEEPGDEFGCAETGFATVLAGEGFFVPDLCVLRQAALRGRGAGAPMRACDVVAEITMPETAPNDRTKKWRAYARGGVPQYLLIDPYDPGGPTSTLFTDPARDGYRDSERVPFGGRISLLDPVPLLIDTGAFPFPDEC